MPFSSSPETLTAYTDGSGTHAHTPGGAGILLTEGGTVLVEALVPLPRASNQFAECWALGYAVNLLRCVAGRRPALLVTDSQWAIDACNPGCTWNIRDPRLAELCARVRKALLEHGAVTLRWCKGHRRVPKDGPAELVREILGNTRADALAGMARQRALARHGTTEPQNHRTT